MICLNSIIELIGRISTMWRTLRASTPVDRFCDVVSMVSMVGMVFSWSWKSRRCCPPRAPSLAVTRTQSFGSATVLRWLIGRRTASACDCVAQNTGVFSRGSMAPRKIFTR